MKFKIGDKVRIINYGHAIWMNKSSGETPPFPIIAENDSLWWMDMCPDRVGKTGIVDNELNGDYSVYDIGAWFTEAQLELVEDAVPEINFSITQHESIFDKDYIENHDFGDEDEHIKDLMKERGF
jgi:hypothetical protein